MAHSDPEAGREYRRQYGVKNRDAIRERARLWRLDNPERARANDERKDKSKLKAYQKKYYAEHREVAIARARERYQTRGRAKDGPTQIAYARMRRAATRGVHVERIDPLVVEERDRGMCYLCGEYVEKDRTLD